MANAGQLRRARKTTAPAAAIQVQKAAPPPPNPSQLVANARDALQVCEDGMAAYSTLQRMLTEPDIPTDKRAGRLAPRFSWEAAPPNGASRPVVTDLGRISSAEDRSVVLTPLVNLHFDQMLAGAVAAKKAVDVLVDLLHAAADHSTERHTDDDVVDDQDNQDNTLDDVAGDGEGDDEFVEDEG